MPERVNTPFSARTTADEVLEGVDLSGRRALVTGGASGIGTETVRALAYRAWIGRRVYEASRVNRQAPQARASAR